MKRDLTIRLDGDAEYRVWIPGRGSPPAKRGRSLFMIEGENVEADWCEIAPGSYSVVIASRCYTARISPSPESGASRRTSWQVAAGGKNYRVAIEDPNSARFGNSLRAHKGPQEIAAPMPGRIVKILVEEGQQVQEGQGLLVIEAMKMQNELRAAGPGRVERIFVAEGKGIEAGTRLLRIA